MPTRLGGDVEIIRNFEALPLRNRSKAEELYIYGIATDSPSRPTKPVSLIHHADITG